MVKVGDGEFKPMLRPQHRLIAVEASQADVHAIFAGGKPDTRGT